MICPLAVHILNPCYRSHDSRLGLFSKDLFTIGLQRTGLRAANCLWGPAEGQGGRHGSSPTAWLCAEICLWGPAERQGSRHGSSPTRWLFAGICLWGTPERQGSHGSSPTAWPCAAICLWGLAERRRLSWKQSDSMAGRWNLPVRTCGETRKSSLKWKSSSMHPQSFLICQSFIPESVWATGYFKSGGLLYIVHLHMFTSSHPHMFTYSHLLIFTASHPHIFTHLLSLSLFFYLSLSLLPSVTVSLLLFLFFLKPTGSADEAPRYGHPFARNEVPVSPTEGFSRAWLVRR